MSDVLSAQKGGDGMGSPPEQGHVDAAGFFRRFSAFFLHDFGIPIFFKRQNVEEKSAPA